jgi:hypothetical protein
MTPTPMGQNSAYHAATLELKLIDKDGNHQDIPFAPRFRDRDRQKIMALLESNDMDALMKLAVYRYCDMETMSKTEQEWLKELPKSIDTITGQN